MQEATTKQEKLVVAQIKWDFRLLTWVKNVKPNTYICVANLLLKTQTCFFCPL